MRSYVFTEHHSKLGSIFVGYFVEGGATKQTTINRCRLDVIRFGTGFQEWCGWEVVAFIVACETARAQSFFCEVRFNVEHASLFAIPLLNSACHLNQRNVLHV